MSSGFGSSRVLLTIFRSVAIAKGYMTPSRPIASKTIRSLDLNLLKALDALLDERSVTRAASLLGVTQPAMSAMLMRLRETFNDPLFVRAQRGVIPTQRALELAKPVKQVLGEIGVLLQTQGFDPGTAELTFTIAATDYGLRAVATPFLPALKRLAPHIRVALVPIDDEKLHAQLERAEVDLALATPQNTPPGLHTRHLFNERYVGVMRTGHPAASGRRRLTLSQFCSLDHALVSYKGGSFTGVTDEALSKHGYQRRVTLSVKSFLILPEILRSSDLIAVVPRRLAVGVEGIVMFDPPVEIPGFTKVAAWHERTHLDVAHRWLRELLHDTCGDSMECEETALPFKQPG